MGSNAPKRYGSFWRAISMKSSVWSTRTDIGRLMRAVNSRLGQSLPMMFVRYLIASVLPGAEMGFSSHVCASYAARTATASSGRIDSIFAAHSANEYGEYVCVGCSSSSCSCS